MKYIFCGLMYPNIEEDLRKMKTPPPVSGHKFQVNMLTGLIENKQDVYVLNIPKYRYFPHYKKIFVKCGEFTSVKYAHGRNLGYINLPILNYISIILLLLKFKDVKLVRPLSAVISVILLLFKLNEVKFIRLLIGAISLTIFVEVMDKLFKFTHEPTDVISANLLSDPTD